MPALFRSFISAALIVLAAQSWPIAAAANKMESEDVSLLKDLAQSNIAEVFAGSAALERTENPDVKTFAQLMVNDHSNSLSEIRSLASARGVHLPQRPDANHREVLGELKSLKGEGFDRRYMKKFGVADLESTEQLLRRIERSSNDPELKALATKLLPMVQQQLKRAEGLFRALN